jgi:lysophospholipase L1-like esterase
MILMKRITILFILLILCGCSTLPEFGIVTSDTAQTASLTRSPDEPETEVYQTYTFTESDEIFLSSCIFIGDSLFGNLADSGLLRAGQVLRDEGARVSDVTERRFIQGGAETYLLTTLVNHAPENIIILLGMNDIAFSCSDEFTADYLRLISFIKTYCPDTVITVLSLPPVSREAPGYTNELVTEYNAALRTAIRELGDNTVRFLNLNIELGNSHGRLKSRFAADDGVHLTTQGLYAVLWAICNSMN